MGVILIVEFIYIVIFCYFAVTFTYLSSLKKKGELKYRMHEARSYMYLFISSFTMVIAETIFTRIISVVTLVIIGVMLFQNAGLEKRK